MKLPKYNITYIISDPDEPSTALKVTLESCKREAIIKTAPPVVVQLLQTFEAMVEDK